MNYVIILAGGIGSRFWPLSRDIEPKQFLEVYSKTPMLAQTLKRIEGFVASENIYVAANRLHKDKISQSLSDFCLPKKNVFLEPEGKNTLAPIGFLSHKINRIHKDAVIMVLPCDHFIRDKKKFQKFLKKATDIARQGYIVTMGIKPVRPETGYGYLESAEKIKGLECLCVKKFIEKPALDVAKKIFRNKKYYWNGGMFIFRADTLLNEIKRLCPQVYRIISKERESEVKALWRKLPSLSIDYGVMEKTRRIVLLPADFGWVDVGSWQAVAGLIVKDRNNNIFKGNCVDLESKNSLVWGHRRLVATVGLNNIVIVDTPDALLVCAKDKTQDVKRLVEKLKIKNAKKHI
jgi:mannose-1-phosphate guanylyltransferase